jgi:hypothetical protein
LVNQQITPDGFSIISQVIEPAQCQQLIELLGAVPGAGRRGLLAIPAVAALARSERILDLIRPHLAGPPVPVRSIYFDKSQTANWLVSWHQDLTLAVTARADVPGFGPWSHKEGVPHVQPPIALLEQMLTLRLHLDPADESNGALQVLPGSHRLGRLAPEQINAQRSRVAPFLCAVTAGDALLMRPLLLHASARSTAQAHRRILHIEYAGFTLPDTLRWHENA